MAREGWGAAVKVEQLDEFQGLTHEMVRAAAEAMGFTYRDGDLYAPNGSMALMFALNPHCIPAVLGKLADHRRVSIQVLLRDINPRLRKGLPSEAARAAHNGLWIAQAPEMIADRTPLVGRWYGDKFGTTGHTSVPAPSAWSFWPCDAAANKCRWPERNGVLL